MGGSVSGGNSVMGSMQPPECQLLQLLPSKNHGEWTVATQAFLGSWESHGSQILKHRARNLHFKSSLGRLIHKAYQVGSAASVEGLEWETAGGREVDRLDVWPLFLLHWSVFSLAALLMTHLPQLSQWGL